MKPYFILVIIGIVFIAGCVSQNGTNETIKLGATLPLTGDVASFGLDSQKAMLMAVDEINAKGGINGRQLEIKFEDDQCDGKNSVTTVTKLISVDKVSAIIGPFCSAAMLPAAPIAEQNKVILLSASATNPKITQAGDYIFRNAPSDAIQGKFAAEFAYNTLNARKVSVEYANEEYSVGVKDVFVKRFKELGGQILSTNAHERGSTDMRTQITKIKAENPDLVYLSVLAPANGGNFLTQAKELGLNVTIFSPEALNNPELITTARDASNGLLISTPKPQTTQQFKDAFKAKYNTEPIIYSDYYYDAVYLIANAMKTCGENSGCIKSELYKVKDYKGASGAITLDSNGDLDRGEYVVMTIVNQTFTEYK